MRFLFKKDSCQHNVSTQLISANLLNIIKHSIGHISLQLRDKTSKNIQKLLNDELKFLLNVR